VTLGNRVCGRNADGAADVAEEVKDAAGVAGAFLADGSEGHLGEWDEDHGEADAADSEWARRGCRENVQGKGGEPEAGRCRGREAAGDHVSGIELGDKRTYDERGDRAEAARADSEA
jgi:hypothetical protein